MTFDCAAGNASEAGVDTLVYFCFEEDRPSGAFLKALDRDTDGALGSVYESGEFSGRLNSSAVLRRPSEWNVDSVALAGVGKRAEVSADRFRQAAGTISRLPVALKSSELAFASQGRLDPETCGALVEGYQLGSWELLDYKTGDDVEPPLDQSISILLADQAAATRAKPAVRRSEIIAQAVALCRNLAFQPSNVLTPEILAAEATRQGKLCGFSAKVLDVKGIEREKMGALLAVNQGSANQARFIIMQYTGGRKGQKPIALVGKGVTFDTGGISLKPGLNMHEMKGDMTGSAVVISTMAAVAQLKLKLNVVALVPATENVPSATAYKPGDIITARNGKTIEIINTDAEGRLILADALDYANKFNPQAVIDIATLTGATLFILGHAGAPIFSTHTALAKQLRAASEVTAEKIWEMPLWPEYAEQMKSKIADLVNSGGRPAGTATAAAFLSEFIGDYPWAHIDIAYVDLEYSGKPYIPRGPSGFGTRLLVELLSNWKSL
ncbi:MAG: leucyl aminopeptidase [Candidatus Zixiibacteriota bacterium]